MDDQRPRGMAELFAEGEETVAAPRDAVRAAGLIGLLTVLTTLVAVIAAVVVTVAFFVTVFGGLALVFGAAPPIR